MKLTPIGTLADTESGVDYYRLSDLFNTDEFVVRSLLKVIESEDEDERDSPLQALHDAQYDGIKDTNGDTWHAAVREIEDYLRDTHGIWARHCNCSHDCCGHRFYSAPDLLPDFLRDEFIIAHSWGINVARLQWLSHR